MEKLITPAEEYEKDNNPSRAWNKIKQFLLKSLTTPAENSKKKNTKNLPKRLVNNPSRENEENLIFFVKEVNNPSREKKEREMR